MPEKILNRILEGKIIAIVRGIPSTSMLNLVASLYKGGINCVEVTFDQTSEENRDDALKSIAKIKKHFGEKVLVGAGTVMTSSQVQLAIEAGAEYIISPNVDEDVIKETKSLGKISIPGAFTPSEVALAYKYGADIVKLFPAGMLGAEYIKALKAPLKHIRVMAVGGINPRNCAGFISAGAVGVGVGGSLVSKNLVIENRFDEIEAIAGEYIKSLRGY